MQNFNFFLRLLTGKPFNNIDMLYFIYVTVERDRRTQENNRLVAESLRNHAEALDRQTQSVNRNNTLLERQSVLIENQSRLLVTQNEAILMLVDKYNKERDNGRNGKITYVFIYRIIL